MDLIPNTRFQITPEKKITGDIIIPGDKSISHRAIILSSINDYATDIDNILLSDDVLSTINIMRALGVEIIIDSEKKSARVYGVGLHGLKAPKKPLNCGNSGTTMRLLCGLLSAQKFNSVLIGDQSLSKRPMLRIAEPLRLMGAKINLSENNTAPIEMTGHQNLVGIDYAVIIPSAQVKSGILLASLYASGKTTIREIMPTRDHTEKMLLSSSPDKANFGTAPGKANFSSSPGRASALHIPGDISSAAFFIVLAAITKDSDITLREVGVNPFRTGIITILKLMGADIELFHRQFFGEEPVADIRIKYAPLHGITIPSELISKSIDEFPIIFIAAVTAKGNTVLRGARELRIKESDRITAMIKNFNALNIKTIEYDDGILIYGEQEFHGGRVNSFGDHRIAMSFAIAGNSAKDTVFIDDCACVNTSFPDFAGLIRQVGMDVGVENEFDKSGTL